MELTVQRAASQSADFMYIWADENKFLRYINKKYASIIRTKKANQKKLLVLSAEKYGTTYDAYTTAMRKAFIEQWGHTPAEALIILAQGGQIAGKNWSEGVYGVGALYVDTFVGHEGITVRPEDGHILNNGTDVPVTKTIYTQIKKQAVPYQIFSTVDGVTYTSQYNKTQKKYYAFSYSTADGQYNARTGQQMTASQNSDIWGNIEALFEKFLNWLISLFSNDNRETINAENTLPNQTADGFVTNEAGMGEAGSILLVLAVGGALVASGALGGKKKNRK